jgi:methylenetetrahydrofolate reductase (NADPH)
MSRVTLTQLYKDSAETSTPVISLEFFPPKKAENLSKTKDLIADLAEFDVAYMTVTYGAGGSTRSFTQELAAFIHQKLKARALCHLTCVDHSREDLRTILKALEHEGIQDVLALRGDPAGGAQANFITHPDGFSCARDLIEFINTEFKFSICAAGYPEGHRDTISRNDDFKYLKEKVDKGAQVILTQLFFNPEVYFSFVQECRKVGIVVPIVPGVMPIRDYNQLKKFTDMCGATIPVSLHKKLEKIKDKPQAVVEFGTEYAIQMCRELLSGGAPGIHLYTLNQSDQVRQILNEIS